VFSNNNARFINVDQEMFLVAVFEEIILHSEVKIGIGTCGNQAAHFK